MTKVQQYKAEIEEKSKSPAKPVEPKVKNARNVSVDPGSVVPPQNNHEGINFLSSLLHATIFFDYFEYVANKTYSGNHVETKILKLKTVHPNAHTICLVLDVAVRFIAVAALIIVAIASAYKVVMK